MNKLFNLFTDISDAAFAIDDKQRIIFWNRSAESLFAQKSSAALGQHCWKVMGGVTKGGLSFCRPDCQIIMQMRAGKTVKNIDLLVKGHSGLHTDVNISTIPAAHLTNGEQPLLIHLIRPHEIPGTQVEALRLFLLGPLLVQRVDGSHVEGHFWKNPVVRALLVHLAQAEHGFVDEEELRHVFWPELPRSMAQASLETAVLHLRLCLEPKLLDATRSHYILRHKKSYQINPDIPLWFDTNHVTAQIIKAQLEPNPRLALQKYQAILQLFRGSYLQDLQQQPVWSQNNAQQVDKLKWSILEALGDLYAQLDQPQEAKTHFLQALTLNPDNESAYQKLMHLALPRQVRLDAL